MPSFDRDPFAYLRRQALGEKGERLTRPSGPPPRPFTLPTVGDYDLLYFAPGYPTRTMVSGDLPTVGSALHVTGPEAAYVQESNYTIRAAPGWGGSVAYIIAHLSETAGEVTFIFKTGSKPFGILPTAAILSDDTGDIPFIHIQMATALNAFLPELSYNAPPLTSKNANWTTQDLFTSLPGNTWIICRAQRLGGYQMRMTLRNLGDNTLYGQCLLFSGDLPRYLGANSFYQLFGNAANDFVYGFIGAKSASKTDYSGWPATGFIAAESMLNAPAASWKGSYFNGITGTGSATYDNTNKRWNISSQAYASGGEYLFADPVNENDVIDVYGNVPTFSSTFSSGALVALGSPAGQHSLDSFITGTGDFHLRVTALATRSDMRLIFGGGNGNTSTDFSLRDCLVMKNRIALTQGDSRPA